jgi:DNA polymerase (family 10)
MDLRDEHVRLAVKAGCMFVIDSDAHHPSEFAWLRIGIGTARRGWATSKHVINTRPLSDLMSWLQSPKTERR